MKILAHQRQKELPTFLNDGKPKQAIPYLGPFVVPQIISAARAWYSPSFAQFMLLVTLIWHRAKGLVPGRSKDQTVLRMRELFFSNSGCCFTLPLYGEVHHLENEPCSHFQWGQLLWMGALCFSHLYPKTQGGTERDMKGSWPDCPSYPPQPAGWSQSSIVILSFS